MNAYGINWRDGGKVAPSWEDESMSSPLKLGLLILLSVACIAGNTLCIAAILSDKALRTKGALNHFILALSFSDLGFGCVFLGFLAPTLVNGRFPGGEKGCETMGFFVHLFATASIALLLVVTANRYRRIVKNKGTSLPLAFKGIALAAALGFAHASAALLPGFGHYDLQPSLTFCWARGGVGRGGDDAYLLISWLIITTTLCAISSGYGLMYQAIQTTFARSPQASPGRLTAASAAEKIPSGVSKIRRKEFAILKQFIVITTVFYVSWTPALIQFMAEILSRPILGSHFDYFVAMGALVGSAINPIVYGYMNKPIGRAMRNLAPVCNLSPARSSRAPHAVPVHIVELHGIHQIGDTPVRI